MTGTMSNDIEDLITATEWTDADTEHVAQYVICRDHLGLCSVDELKTDLLRNQ